jgi:NADP-dependent 3-hydroxy acid dehydrogenase YdfG
MGSDGSPLGARTALVTGASRGIGLAVARALADAGARLILVARNAHRLEEAARGLDAQLLSGDVADPSSLDRVVTMAARHAGGAPDILVNNAGLFELVRLETTAPAAFEAALEVNLVAPFRLIRAFLPAMRERRGGDIVSIGSIADHMIFPENGAYAASKFGLRALHEVLRTELRGSGVRVTLVSPGPVDTPLWDPIAPDEREGFTARKQMLSAEAVAAAVVYAVTQPREVDIELVRLSHS